MKQPWILGGLLGCATGTGERMLVWDGPAPHGTARGKLALVVGGLYHPDADRWSAVPAQPAVDLGRGATLHALPGGRVLALGDLAHLYQPESNAWSAVRTCGGGQRAAMVQVGNSLVRWGGPRVTQVNECGPRRNSDDPQCDPSVDSENVHTGGVTTLP